MRSEARPRLGILVRTEEELLFRAGQLVHMMLIFRKIIPIHGLISGMRAQIKVSVLT